MYAYPTTYLYSLTCTSLPLAITILTIISLIYICAMHLTCACVVAVILDNRIEEGQPTLLIPLSYNSSNVGFTS